MMNERRDGRYPHEKSLEGARNSASRRAERSKEDVREVYEHADGVTIVYETHAVRLEGVRRTLIPLDLVDEYPIVMEFANDEGPVGKGMPHRPADRPAIEVRGAMRDVKHEVLRRAASGTVRDADGVMRKLVVWPDELGEGSFRFRLEWWAGYLRERIDARREGSRRAIRDGVTDLESIAAAAEAAGSAARRLAAPDGSGPASGGEEGGYAYLDLVDAVESVLAGASERDAYIFRQHFFQDREYKDIARELGCANSTATYSMKKLLPLVRKCLREPGY